MEQAVTRDQMELEQKRRAMLENGGSPNVAPPCPPAPCLKERSTGILHIWNVPMAKRPDLVASCDETGNEDPASWQGKLPIGMRSDGSIPPISLAKNPVSGLHPTRTSIDIGRAAEFGIDPDSIKSYNEPISIKQAMPFAGMDDYFVEDKIKAIQVKTGLIYSEA